MQGSCGLARFPTEWRFFGKNVRLPHKKMENAEKFSGFLHAKNLLRNDKFYKVLTGILIYGSINRV